MLKIFPNTKIYLLCPSDYITGGVECLHQVSDKLIKLGFDARIFYIPKITENALPQYKNYKIVKDSKIEDKKENILIIPEVWIDKLKEFKKIRKSIFWMSIDNVKKNTTLPIGKINKKFPWLKKRFPKIYDLLKKIYLKINKKGKILFDFKENKNIYHFAQSYYAKDFLLKKGVKKVYILSDYLNKNHFKKRNLNKKENIVVYNPKKGKEITKELIKKSPEIKYVPLQNMTAKEVADTISKSKVYIDFGTHPGKDRLPREAIINGCCVIVGKRGSAKFYEDIPIKKEYKFDIKNLNLNKIIKKIKECLKNYNKKIKDFKNYKKFVENDERQFELEIKRIFSVKK